jgi:Asp-tRNA(Asn)/Glu-tRNA(Gln) amidotransferase A subunit family amidase
MLNPEDIAVAEALLGLDFTGKERQQLLDNFDEQRDHLQTVRSHHLENGVPTALIFDPRLPTPLDMPPIAPIDISDFGEVERPANLEEVAFWPVTHLAQLVKTRQVKSVELTQMYLDRLHHFNQHLECVVTFTDDLALAQAQQADQEIANGRYRGPLHGIPWGAKDLLAVPGYTTTWGAAPFKSQVIDQKATVVQRLEEAGAVLVAKLTLGALAYGDIWFDGTTKNPWDLEEGSSGSSAGSAATVAAGLVGFAIGTETYGSIVSPSTRCGVTGLRPTFGRVSRYGAMALCWSMDKIGPMARSVEDCALIFNAIHGADGLDNHAISRHFNWNPDLAVNRLRIGYYKSAFEAERDNQANDDAVLTVLRDTGIDLIPVEMPEIDIQSLIIILMAEAAATFDELTRHNLDDQLVWQEDEAWPNTFRKARFIPAVEYINANRIRTQLMRDFAALMQDIDVFVTPSFGKDVLLATNLTGHPAVVMPNGFTEKGTPTSISFVGRLFEEDKVLAVAKAWQDATDFHQQHPPMDY